MRGEDVRCAIREEGKGSDGRVDVSFLLQVKRQVRERRGDEGGRRGKG